MPSRFTNINWGLVHFKAHHRTPFHFPPAISVSLMEFNAHSNQKISSNMNLFLKDSFQPNLASGSFMESASNLMDPEFPNSVQFTSQGPSPNPSFGAPTQFCDPFDPYQASSNNSYLISLYASNPCVSSGEKGFKLGCENMKFLNSPSRYPLETMDQSAVSRNFNFQMLGSAIANSPQEVLCSDTIECEHHKRANGRKNHKEVHVKRKINKSRRKVVIIKGQWSCEEDMLLAQLVKQHGVRKWSCIAEKFPGRIGKQCRDRWHNHLRPDITKDAWSEEEDKLLIAIHREVGNKWSEIARRMPGRSENTIKNHWNATKRRQLSSRKHGKPKYHSLLQEYIRSVTSSSSSDDRIIIQENKFLDNKKSPVVDPMIPPLQQPESLGFEASHHQPMMGFSSDANVSSSSSLDEYNLGSMLGDKPGGLMLHDSNSEFDQAPSHWTSQLEFDIKKEMDFLEMLYQ